jgi:diguanylate cyclase (GGDEF)-like protein
MIEAKDLIGDELLRRFSKENILANLEKVERLYKEEGIRGIKENFSFLKDLTRIVFGIDIDDETLLKTWEEIFKSHLELKKNKKTTDIRVIAFDYLVSRGMLSNPKIMELENFKNFIEIVYQDPKTFSYNYLLLKTLVNYEIERINRYGGHFSLILIDIDNFKYYNDSMGHKFGDELLSEFARVVVSNLRRSDILFRYGGDEFVIFCPETRRIGARIVAEKIRESIKSYFSEKCINISVSGGTAVFPGDGNTFEELLEFADNLLYYSKTHGKNKIVDKFDLANENDRRAFPRYPMLSSNKVIIMCGDKEIIGNIDNISKSGMFIRVNNSEADICKSKEMYLHKITLDSREYVLDLPVELARISTDGIGIDFKSNKSLEILVYLLLEAV